MQTKSAATFGRTLSWFEVTCPPGEIRYRARSPERGGLLEEATIREGISGAMMLRVEYRDHVEGLGHRWPRRIEIQVTRRRTTVVLPAVEAPLASAVPDAVFAPSVPELFERRPILVSLTAPGLLGSTADGER